MTHKSKNFMNLTPHQLSLIAQALEARAKTEQPTLLRTTLNQTLAVFVLGVILIGAWLVMVNSI